MPPSNSVATQSAMRSFISLQRTVRPLAASGSESRMVCSTRPRTTRAPTASALGASHAARIRDCAASHPTASPLNPATASEGISRTQSELSTDETTAACATTRIASVVHSSRERRKSSGSGVAFGSGWPKPGVGPR